ncbi:MAG: peptidase MA family metallohydrolase [Ignavibacteria bacterium]|jgi:Tol biopolymer transport system component|nr:peptidase MA family metallohydrolase [Ignavibacteria bacterium]MDH7528843.1 peptidase MA family metallohydrolase [Ignavibacteria bacterium]
MKSKILLLLALSFVLLNSNTFAQFGKNKVQYKKFNYYYIQSKHFDVYFTDGGERLATFAVVAAESALTSIQKNFKYNINNRISMIIYNSHNDFQQTNVVSEYLEEGIGGVTELFKNRVVLPFEGSYDQFRHVIHHELVHAVMNDMFYGGSLQSIISNNITLNLPLWFMEGLAEYEALGWDTHSDMFMRDASINQYLPNINQLDGYFAYRGGQSVFWFIERKYGKEKIGDLLNRIRGQGSFEGGIKSSFGFDLEELNDKWKKDQKVLYWPDIELRKEPNEFSKQLTDHTKDGGFYNTSPAISPQGDLIAFISNRDDYFDVFIMSAVDGKILKKLVKGNTTANFEELHILTPGLCWSPDGKKIALSSKAGASDAIFIFDVKTGKHQKLDIKLDGIFSVDWSPDGKKLAFVGLHKHQSDIFIYDFETKKITNLTNDIFSDSDPHFSHDGKAVFFSSDRGDYTELASREYFLDIINHNYKQLDLYRIDIETREIQRITDLPNSNETSVVASRDGKYLFFVSDLNGINNIYMKDISDVDWDANYSVLVKNPDDLQPITNSLNGIYQISLSDDGKRLAFSSMFKSAYNIFVITNPIDQISTFDKLPLTKFAQSRLLSSKPKEIDTAKVITKTKVEITYSDSVLIKTGNIIDTSNAFSEIARQNFTNYIFNEKFITREAPVKDTLLFTYDRKDSLGNFIVNKYKINFSPDIIYANAGFSTFYGLLGTTVLAFSDMMGDHQIIGITSLNIDLKNSDYGIAYFYLPERTDFTIQAFHTARFLIQERNRFYYLYRYRNYGGYFSASYPIDKFYRIEGGLSWLNVRRDNLDIYEEPPQLLSLLIPSASFVHDNSLWEFTAPSRGTRYNFTIFGVPPLKKNAFNFGTVTGDYRTYFKFWKEYSLTLRLSGGFSFGRNPQKFMLGGTENWINYQFEQNRIPIESAEDFLFLTPVLPLRGYNYSQKLGTKYALMNLEFHFPLIKLLVTSPLPLLFQNIRGVAFLDIGSAWTRNSDFRGTVRDVYGNVFTKDLLIGTGIGTRIYLFGFLLKFDFAWNYNLVNFSDTKFYLSLGTDL